MTVLSAEHVAAADHGRDLHAVLHRGDDLGRQMGHHVRRDAQGLTAREQPAGQLQHHPMPARVECARGVRHLAFCFCLGLA
jgi:hypothetical protein